MSVQGRDQHASVVSWTHYDIESRISSQKPANCAGTTYAGTALGPARLTGEGEGGERGHRSAGGACGTAYLQAFVPNAIYGQKCVQRTLKRRRRRLPAKGLTPVCEVCVCIKCAFQMFLPVPTCIPNYLPT